MSRIDTLAPIPIAASRRWLPTAPAARITTLPRPDAAGPREQDAFCRRGSFSRQAAPT